MSITRKEVEHVAHLARIELNEKETIKFEKELSAILEFVEKLKEVDTSTVKPLTGGTDLQNVWREDEQIDKKLEGKSVELLQAMPEKKDNWLKVKAVFGQD